MERTIATVLLFAISIWLEIFLSKKDSKWLGLVIPIICFMISIMPIIGIILMSETIEFIFAATTPIFIWFNIPTVIFVTIYFACRQKIKSRSELDKMNIQDLG